MNIPLTILSLLYAVYVSYHAVRNRVPVSEWLTLVVIYIGLQVILVPGAPEHLTMALIIGAGLLCVSFFIRFARYAEEKEKLLSMPASEDRLLCYAELSTSDTDASCAMIARNQHGEIMGNLTPMHPTGGYEFLFLSPVHQLSLVRTGSGSEYQLSSEHTTCLTLRPTGRNKMTAEGANFRWELPLYTRTIHHRGDDSSGEWSMKLFYEGILLSCDKHLSESLLCVGYYLWMQIFADLRRGKG